MKRVKREEFFFEIFIYLNIFSKFHNLSMNFLVVFCVQILKLKSASIFLYYNNKKRPPLCPQFGSSSQFQVTVNCQLLLCAFLNASRVKISACFSKMKKKHMSYLLSDDREGKIILKNQLEIFKVKPEHPILRTSMRECRVTKN